MTETILDAFALNEMRNHEAMPSLPDSERAPWAPRKRTTEARAKREGKWKAEYPVKGLKLVR